NYSFLRYEWYKEGDENHILSTTNQLIFTEFDSEIHTGTYDLNITANNASSCMNQVMEFELEFNLPEPNAGEDVSVAFCHTGEEIDLLSLFSSLVDDFGTWEDISGTGMLNGNILSTENLALGTYLFKYSVTVDCVGTAEATITFSLVEIPQAPVIAALNPFCQGEAVEIALENPKAQYTYVWTAPDGATFTRNTINFTETLLQDNGTYTVTAQLGDCISEPSQVMLQVKPLPEFTISGNTILCPNQSSILSVQGNFNSSEVDFVWYF